MLTLLSAMAGNARAQCPDGTPPPCGPQWGRPRGASRASVAVLYFDNLSRDSNDAFLAEGLTEEIIARLSQVASLRVASRHATLRYRGRRVRDPRQVGRDLGVRYVLDGTLRRAGERLRIVLAITDAAAGFNVWGQSYERRLDEIFSVEDTIAVQVAEALRGRLTGRERAQLAPAGAAVNVEAYQAYLRGRVAIRARTAAAAAAAIAHYRQAITLDPRFARAWAGLAHALSLAREWGWPIPGITAEGVQGLATRAADTALSLDSASAESWQAAAMAERAHDVRRALQYHRRAVALDPANVEALHQLAWGYLGNGELDSGIAIERRVVARDTYYAYAFAGLGQMLNVVGRPAEALAVLAQGMAVDSTHAPLYWQMADALLQLGRTAEARASAARAEALGFDSIDVHLLLAHIRLADGDTADVQMQLPVLERMVMADSTAVRGGLAYNTAGVLSGLYARLGDVDGAVRWAQVVAESARRFYAVLFARHWFWAPVRDAPAFQALLASLRR